jgi:general secretion pathway protein G
MGYNKGLTLIELVIVIAIIGLIAAIALPKYTSYQEQTKVAIAIQDIRKLEELIKIYCMDADAYPDSLADIGQDGKLDPWGSPYQYYNIDKNGIGHARKDKSLVPLNSDFDLYSMGKDKITKKQLTQKDSLDDIVRASDGRFLNLASNY